MPRHTLLVLAHPRTDSLTAQVADLVHARLKDGARSVDVLDLYAEGFDPVLRPADEPDWENREKAYTAEVHAHMDRILAADDIVVVFPVWWMAPPAVLKGWIDRVWNYGFAYGRSKPRLAAKRMLWLALMGNAEAEIEQLGLSTVLDLQLRVAVSRFCGIEDSSVEIVYGTELSGVPRALRPQRVRELLKSAEESLIGALPR
ncbi:NAD(P)H oxidoreductase [Streptomyces sp. NBC_01353]|uniref:NAD(P)H oxidoreductase n=1 Tax=Streptomyces sp. NBC_01353 TaxID=2903835 RepID=UPI002E3053E9|nr:NAD(P)H oxidoreductase [Streptomyces sp. NBC_01353]